MQLSHYIKTYPCEDKPGYFLVYSTKKASMILLKKETCESLEKGMLSPADEAMLSRLGIMSTDREEEKRVMHNLLNELNTRNSGLNITVVLNLDCNFKCKYCYEGDIKGKFYMTDEMADLMLDFIKDKFTPEKKAINIDFYGGEPLLSAGLIKSISRDMKSFTESRGASYTFTLVTNGSLFKRRIAEDLASMGLQSVKITIDGPPEIHNLCRPFKSGAASFDTIMGNIKETCDIVKTGIGGNFQRDNYESFPRLLDYLEKEGLTHDRIYQLKFDPVMKRPKGDTSPTDYIDGYMSINEPWVIKAGALLREEVLRRGYHTPKLMPMPCQVEITDSYVVNFDGVIYKCPAFIGKKGFEIGNLRDGVMDYSDSYKLGIWKNEECAECDYLPLCFGGCRYMAYIRDGNIDNIDCKRAYFDATLETLIKQDIKYKLKDNKKVRTEDGQDIDISEMTYKIDRVIAKYFPEQFKSFNLPSMDRITSFYRNADKVVQIYIYGKSPVVEGHKYFVKSAFITAAAIRYIDDFIDNALWADIPEFDPTELTVLFEEFLLAVLKTVRKFDPDMPGKTIELPRLEMYLTLHPTQENFDQNFKKLFEYKSFDIFCVYQKIHGASSEKINHDKLIRLGLIDYIRDFSDDAVKTDTDLNLYKYVRDNNINPQKLLDYLIYIYKREDPAGYRKAKGAGLFNGIESSDSSFDEDTRETDILFHESFFELYVRAVNLLRELL